MNDYTPVLPILVVGATGYFLPLLIAFLRNVPNKGSVFVINLLLGWTLIGWVVSLAMAARSKASFGYTPSR